MAYSGFTTTNFLSTSTVHPDLTGRPLSVFAYAKSTATAANQTIFNIFNSAATTTNVLRCLALATTFRIRAATVSAGVQVNQDFSTAMPSNKWSLIGLMWYPPSSSVDIAINNSKESGSVGTAYPTGINTLNIGVSSQATNPWTGSLSDLAIWNAILSTDDILDLANGISPLFVRRANLVNYYPLTDNFNDAVGTHNLTLTGTLTQVTGPNIFRDQGISVTTDHLTRTVRLDLHFGLDDAILTEWEFSAPDSVFYVTTQSNGVTPYANVFESGLNFIKMQLPIGQTFTVRVRQKTNFGWSPLMNEMTLNVPYFNSYDRYLDLSGLSDNVSNEIDSDIYGFEP